MVKFGNKVLESGKQQTCVSATNNKLLNPIKHPE